MRFRALCVALAGLTCVACGSQTTTAPTPAPTPVTVSAPGPEATPPDAGDAGTSTIEPRTGTANVLVGAGDIAMCDGGAEATARIVDRIDGTVITVGDNAYWDGSNQNFRECYEPTWGRFKARTRPAPGNHEYESAGAAPYFAYFGASAGPSGLGYYSYDVGSWLVLSLNSNGDISRELHWLYNVLERNRARCTIAYWHHPLYSSGANPAVPQAQQLWDALYTHNADVIVTAHDHLYQRFAPQDERGRLDAERGMREFVVGTGGAPLQTVQPPTGNSEMLIYSMGVLKLTLSADSYDWEFIPVSGAGDSGSGRCH
jgi:hypothetical protein